VSGSITLSCGHQLVGDYDTGSVSVRIGTYDCDAVEGFYPCVSYGVWCPSCADRARGEPEWLETEQDADLWLAGEHPAQREVAA
jgi:hypothetical protein